MNPGIYSVQFSTGPRAGSGVAVVQGHTFQGGDAGFIYRGRFETTGNAVSASVEVIQHLPGQPSVFGSGSNFELKLEGTLQGDSFTLAGSIPGQPTARISMSGRKRSDLVV